MSVDEGTGVIDRDKFLKEYAKAVETGKFPSRYYLSPPDILAAMTDPVAWWRLREEFIGQYGFAILCEEAVEELRPYSPWIEIGAGSGHWTKALCAAGLDVIGTEPGKGKWQFKFAVHAELESLSGRESVLKYRDRNVLSVWPTYQQSWAAKAFAVMKMGRILALVHEGNGGCVGDKQMYEVLEKQFTEIAHVSLPQFPGIHDGLTLYRKGA